MMLKGYHNSRGAAALSLTLIGCLSSPARPTSSDGGSTPDAAWSDGRSSDALLVTDAAVDANAVVATPWPPAGVTLNITKGWAGDINDDGIDDVILLNETGNSGTNGVYVLLGQPGARATHYHQFLATGDRNPVALTLSDLDGNGMLDLIVFAMKFGPVMPDDNDGYLQAYMNDGPLFADTPLVNWLSPGINMSWQILFNPGAPAHLFTARLTAGSVPSIIGVHERGGFKLSLPSWSGSNFTTESVQMLTDARQTGGAAVVNLANAGVDDLILWTDEANTVTWLVNDGSGNLSPTAPNGRTGTRGPIFGALWDMDGTPPLDVIGALQTEINAFPVDTDAGTETATYLGQTYITGVDSATAMLVFDSDASDPRPEIMISSPACVMFSNNACLFLIRNAYINGTTGELDSPSGPGQYELPSGFETRVMVRGDFDDDDNPEVLLFAANGDVACARVADGVFSACN